MSKALLDGVRMVEMGAFFNGIACGFMLGDLGADVVKIEDPIRGDSYRGMSQMYGDVMNLRGRHIGFELANRNKRSVTLDLKRNEGRQILYELVTKTDVFYSNYSAVTLQKLGADYSTLKRHNPQLIYATANAYGGRGPEGHKKRAFDIVGLARSGMMWMMGEPDNPEPSLLAGAICDQMGAIMMAYGILGALFAREKSGIGQELEISLVGSTMFLNAFALNVGLLRGRPWARHSRKRARNPLGNYYRCADEKWLLLAEPQSDRFWGDFCEAVGIDHLKENPLFASSLARRKNYEALINTLDNVFAGRPRDEWLRIFAEKGVEMSYSPIYDVMEAANDTQAQANNYVVDFDHPAFGTVRVPGYPVRYSETPARIQREAPEHGQHTEEVLNEWLGYSWEEIAQLRETAVL